MGKKGKELLPAVLTDSKGQEVSSSVLFFARELAYPGQDQVYLYGEEDWRLQERRNTGLRKQLQPAYDRLTADNDFQKAADSYLKSIPEWELQGTCDIQLNDEGMKQLRDLLTNNGANITGTRPKYLRRSLTF